MFGWTGQRLGWTGKCFGWTGGNPRLCYFRWGGGDGGGIARGRKEMVNRYGGQRDNERCWNKGIRVNGESLLAVVMPLAVREGAVAWSRPATGAVAMTTRNFDSFPLINIGG